MNNLIDALWSQRELSHFIHYIAFWVSATPQEQKEFVEFYAPDKLAQGHLKKAMTSIANSLKV